MHITKHPGWYDICYQHEMFMWSLTISSDETIMDLMIPLMLPYISRDKKSVLKNEKAKIHWNYLFSLIWRIQKAVSHGSLRLLESHDNRTSSCLLHNVEESRLETHIRWVGALIALFFVFIQTKINDSCNVRGKKFEEWQ